MKIAQRQQFLLVLTVAAAGLFVGVNYIFTPLAGWWSNRSAQLKDLRTKVSDGKKLITREANVRSHWNDMLSNVLPENTSLAEQQMLKSLDDWAHSSGSEIASIMPQWKSDSTNYMTLNCHVEANGTLGALSQFLYDIEKGQALRVNSVELSAHDPAGQQLTLGLQVSGLALLQPTKK